MKLRALGYALLTGWLLLACSGVEQQDGGHAGGADSHAGTSQGGHSGDGGRPAEGGRAPTGGGSVAGGGGDDPVDGQLEPRGACATGKRTGRFSVEKQKDFGVVQGTILDGVVPTSIPELVSEQDGCKLFRRRNLSCSPACVSSETCGETGKCIPYPAQISVGGVLIEGLTKPVKMDPQRPGAVYFAPGQDNPPFVSDARVGLKASGADQVAPFELFGRGSDPLPEAPTWVLEQGKALELAWPAGSDVTTVSVELTIDQHGSTPLSLACELPDNGSAQVPSTLIDDLIGSGVSGFPNGRIQRRTVDHVDSALGCVELSVGSVLAARVRVAGFTPCKSNQDCPSGTTCDPVQERCF